MEFMESILNRSDLIKKKLTDMFTARRVVNIVEVINNNATGCERRRTRKTGLPVL